MLAVTTLGRVFRESLRCYFLFLCVCDYYFFLLLSLCCSAWWAVLRSTVARLIGSPPVISYSSCVLSGAVALLRSLSPGFTEALAVFHPEIYMCRCEFVLLLRLARYWDHDLYLSIPVINVKVCEFYI